MLKRYTIYDRLSDQYTSERYFFRKPAQQLKEAVEFLYVLDGIKRGYVISDEVLDQQIQVVRV